MSGLQSRDPETTRLLAALRGPVERLLSRMLGDPWGRDEAMQETWIAVLQNLETARRVRNPHAWALQIAYRKGIDQLRSESRTRHTADLEDVPAATADQDRVRELRSWLLAAMEHLRPDQRAILHLRFEEDLSPKEIARVMDKSRGTVRRWLHEAQRDLGRALDRTSAGMKVPFALALLPLLSGKVLSVEATLTAAAVPAAGFAASIGSAAAWGLGVIIMKKTMVCVAVLCLLGGMGWWVLESRKTPDVPGPSTTGALADPPTQESAENIPATHGPKKPDAIETKAFEAPKIAGVFIRGRVVAEGGAPVSGARVDLMHQRVNGRTFSLQDPNTSVARLMVETDVQGNFEFLRPESERGQAAMLAATSEGHAPSLRNGILLGGNDPIVLVLRAGRRLRGTVEDIQGNHIKGATVKFRSLLGWGRWARETTSDDLGNWTLQALPLPDDLFGNVEHVHVAHPDFAPVRKAIPTSAWAPASEPGGAVLRVQVARGGIVEGVVSRARVKAPAPDVDVVLWAFDDPAGTSFVKGMALSNAFGSRILARTRTDAEGRYRFEHVPVEVDDIKAMGSSRWSTKNGKTSFGGVVAHRPGVGFANDAVSLMVEDGARQVIDLELSAMATAFGRVVDGQGMPLAGVRVGPIATFPSVQAVPGEGAPFGAWSETDDQGRWRLENLPVGPEGARTMDLDGCGCHLGLARTQRQSVALVAGQEIEVPDFELSAQGLKGLVTDDNGKPIAGATVLIDYGLGTTSDWEGRWRHVVPPLIQPNMQRYVSVHTTLAGYAPSDQQVDVMRGEVSTTLSPGRPLAGKVLLPDGSPAQDLRFTLSRRIPTKTGETMMSQIPTGKNSPTNDSGEFRLHDVPSGDLQFVVARKGVEEKFTVIGGDENVVIRLAELPIFCDVVIHVVTEGGAPFMGSAQVRLRFASEPLAMRGALPGEGPGVFVFENLRVDKGDAVVSVQPTGMPAVTLEKFPLAAPRVKHTVTLEEGFTLPVSVHMPPAVPTRSFSVMAVALEGPQRSSWVKCDDGGVAKLQGLTEGEWVISANHRTVKETWVAEKTTIVRVGPGRGGLEPIELTLVPGVTQFLKIKVSLAERSKLGDHERIELTILDVEGNIRYRSTPPVMELMNTLHASTQLPRFGGRLRLVHDGRTLAEEAFEDKNSELDIILP